MEDVEKLETLLLKEQKELKEKKEIIEIKEVCVHMSESAQLVALRPEITYIHICFLTSLIAFLLALLFQG